MLKAFRRRKLLLRGEMIKHRIFHFSFPGFEKRSFPYTISNICGHGAFLFLAISYLEVDLLNLRLFAFSGISLSMIFQFYREHPLIIPLRWNSLFLAINTFMIARIFKEKADAQNISADQRMVFEGLFERRNMKQEDFCKLMADAERIETTSGEKIIHQGENNHYVYLLLSGALVVTKKDRFVARLDKLSYAGEMSYLRWQANPQSRAEGEVATSDVLCVEDCVLFRWAFRDLDHLMRSNPVVAVIFESCVSNEMNRKFNMEDHNKALREYDTLLHGAMMDGMMTDKEREILADFRKKNAVGDAEHEQLVTALGWTMAEYQAGTKGGADVKVVDEYLRLLCQELQSGTLSSEGRGRLRVFRKTNKISSEKHFDLMADLGWSYDEYEEGQRTARVVPEHAITS
jgi:CRP-like cAMP-binding protein